MDEKKNNENQSYLSGFDSVEQSSPKKEGTFNPTPMFSGMNSQNGYTVTPEGSFFTPSNNNSNVDEAKQNSVLEQVSDTNAPNDAPDSVVQPKTESKEAIVTSSESVSPAEETIVTTPDTTTNEKVEQPPKTDTPVFIPNGTYSYSSPSTPKEAPSEPTVTPKVDSTPYTPKSDDNRPASAYSASAYSPVSNTTSSPASGNSKKENKPKKYGAGVVILSVLLAALIGAGSGIFGVYFAQKNFGVTDTASTSSKEETTTQQVVPNITVDETVNSSIEAVAKKAGPSIIGIRTTAAVTNFFGGSSEATGEGSGIIYSQDGYIITNYHVIESAVESTNSKVEVFLASDTETAINATVIGYNIASDLAVVKVEKTGLPAIEFADSDKLSVGQYAIAIGNPGGLEFIGSVSSGVISGLNRSVTIGTGNTMSLIQTDAAINPGNSGGALVDINGKLIGVNSVKLVSTGYEGMGFAIPSNTVKQICDNIIDKQNDPTPYLGIQISQSYSAEQLIALGYPAGAVVVSVDEGGPAYESKIQRGDIITEFNGITINDYKELENAIAQCKPGDSVTIKIFRAGRFYSSHINVAANNAQ